MAQLLRLKNNQEMLNLSQDLFQQSPGNLICPACEQKMTQKIFRSGDGLTIDQCPNCYSVWLDQGELGKSKRLVREYFGKHGNKLGKKNYFRAYPVAKTVKKLPMISPRMPMLDLSEDERDENAEERELEQGTTAAEVTWGIWAFTALTGMPLEAYNPPRRRFPYVVITLIVVNVLIHWLIAVNSATAKQIYYTYGAVPQAVMHGHNLFSLITHAFLHASWPHLLFNMYFLWVFGDNVEDRLGHGKFIFFYGICALLSGIGQLLTMGYANIPLVGASGAIAGVMGAYLYFFPKAAFYQAIIIPYPLKIPAVVYLGGWVLIQFFGHLHARSNIAWWAHLCGFFVGLFLAWLCYNLRRVSETQALT